MQDFSVNVDDILSEGLMPAALLSGEEFHEEVASGREDRQDGIDLVGWNRTEDGSWGNAFSTMLFHRDKINEYKCSNFLTDNLIAEMFPNSRILNKRLGVVAGNASLDVAKGPPPAQNMLHDEGSSAYSHWLDKSTTLEDIYNNYMRKNSSLGAARRRTDRIFDHNHAEYEDWETDYEEGDITGYAVHNPPVSEVHEDNGEHHLNHGELGHPGSDSMTYSYGNNEHNYNTHMHPQVTAGSPPITFSSPFYTLSYPPISVDDFGKNFHLNSDFLNTNEVLTAPGYYEHDDYPMMESKFGKALGLKDLFEIALTTLAFLSFGMFLLHVIMCITMGTNNNNMMMMPMDMPPETEEIRGKREAPYSLTARMNDLARITLMSIDAAQIAHKDKGECLHLAICENNRLSRTFKDSSKYWIPLWSLGMTWYSTRVLKEQSMMVSVIDSLKAALLGLGGADCSKQFSKCDYTHQKNQKILIRKKRKAENYVFNWSI
ncbi:uncharacterized protein LOC129792322 [Lutzomyia longipalpis]|uniref:uncharacterized protein LOC129792322 n=1 Tax=Lutzomyia longipalpis TaxID=7200 RepID=UPI002483A88D|nr:uncharacterized protein LOC129792322 [Lutzomyia longipalpis]